MKLLHFFVCFFNLKSKKQGIAYLVVLHLNNQIAISEAENYALITSSL